MSTITSDDILFDVKIGVVEAPADLSSEDRATVLATMHKAADAARAVLAAPGQAMPASLAAAVAATVLAHDRLAALRATTTAQGVGALGNLAAAVEAFNGAFSAMKTRFEQEFPHAGH